MQRRSLIDVSNAEINIQQYVFMLVVFPVAGLFFPAISLYWAAYAFIGLTVGLGWPKDNQSLFLSIWPQFIGISIFLGIVGYLFYLFQSLRDKKLQISDRRLKQVPGNEKGTLLLAKVERIWKGIAVNGVCPESRWFVNFNVLARATDTGKTQTIEISSGLWERAITDDWLSELILAHEVAHLVHGDITIFQKLNIMTLAVRRVVRALLYIAAAALAYSWIYEIANGISGQTSVHDVIIHIIGAPVVAFFVLLPLIAGEMIIRRYGGFVTSLMEMRADVTAKEWLDAHGITAEDNESDPTIHKNSLKELGHSLFSLNLTHIPNSERFNIMASIDRLLSPKLRYFSLSLALVLMIPLNSFTPMLYNGAIDHMFVAITVVALHGINFAMLVNTPVGLRLSLKRSGIMAFALFLATGLVSVNAYQLGYYLTVFGASFFAPNGFADTQLEWPTLYSDFCTGIGGMLGEFSDAFQPLDSLFWVALSTVLLYYTSHLLSKSGIRLPWLALALFIPSVFLAIYDPARNMWYPEIIENVASFFAESTYVVGLMYCLPLIALFLYASIVRVLT